MNDCVKLIWADVKISVPEPDQDLPERDQVAYIQGVLAAQKSRGKNPYSGRTSLHKQFDIGHAAAKEEQQHSHDKLKASQKKLRDKKHGFY